MELPKAVTKGDGRLFLVLFIALVFTLQGQNKIILKKVHFFKII